MHKEGVLKKAKRMRFTPQQRQQILKAATTGSLTAKQVQQKYGVSMVTYYLWRRKAGIARSRGGVRLDLTQFGTSKAGLEKLVRSAVRARIQASLPAIVRDEVQTYLNQLLAKAPGSKSGRTA
jgi:transposase-like protein